MNQDLILDRLTNNIIDYTIKTREKVYNNVRERNGKLLLECRKNDC